MYEHFEEKALELLKTWKRITPVFIMRKFKINADAANKICARIWLKQHLEARKLAAELGEVDWPAQLDRVKLKNLEKIKINKK